MQQSKELIIICVRCQKQRALDQMVPDKRRERGHQGYCKICDRRAKRQRRDNYTWAERKASNINILTCRRNNKSPGFTAKDIEYLWDRHHGCCYYCGKAVNRDGIRDDDDAFEIDHVVPDEFHDLNNLVVACRRCNILKHANTLETLYNFIEKIESHLNKYPHLAS